MKTRDASLVALGLAVLLSGCDARQGVAQLPTPSEPRGMKQQLAELERTGVLPWLDLARIVTPAHRTSMYRHSRASGSPRARACLICRGGTPPARE